MKDVESLQPDEGKHQLSAHDHRFGDTWTKLRYANARKLVILHSHTKF